MTAALAGLLVPVVAVFLSLLALGVRKASDSALVTLGVSIGCGLGLASLVTFWWGALGLAIGPRLAAVDAFLWMAAGTAAWLALRRARAQRVSAARGPRESLTTADWLVRGTFCATAAIAVATVVAHYTASPHGEWDAWAIWNLKARFLVRDANPWDTMLAVRWSQPSHPFFVSLSVARLWAYAGSETTLVPAMLGMVWGIGIVIAVMGVLDTRRKRAWIAGSVLIAPGTFTRLVAAQTADLAVALFVIATLVMLRSAITSSTLDAPHTHVRFLLAGALGGFAAWTKNEGFLLVGIATLILTWMTLRRRRLRDMAWWVAGAVPACGTIVWFKLAIAPVAPEYIAESQGVASLFGRSFDPARHVEVMASIGWRWLEWGGPMAAGILPLMIAAAGLALFTRSGGSVRPLLAAASAMLAAYYTAWILSPLDTEWLVRTTFDRLLIQLWPSLVLTAFVAGTAEDLSAGSAPLAASSGPGR